MTPIGTDRLILRRFREDDAEDLFAYLHRPAASCFFSMKLDDMQKAREEARVRTSAEDIFAIEHRRDGRVIGEISGHPEPPDTYSIAWQLNSEFAGQGFAFEAARAVMQHLFEVRGVRRIYAYVEVDNLASARLCLRLGMRLEGVFREFITFEDDADGAPVYVDTQQFAILKKEWRAIDPASHPQA